MANQTINELTQITSLQNTTEFPVWDNSTEKTKKTNLQQLKNSIAEGIVAGVSFIGTRAQYEVAKLIPVGTEGHIPSGSLVIITDENRTYVTSGTGSSQTLQLVARVMSAGNGINISNDDKINADTVTFTGTRAEWEALSSSAKAKYNIVNFTDEELTNDVITNTVEDGNMLAVTSNAVFKGTSPNYANKVLITNTTSQYNSDYTAPENGYVMGMGYGTGQNNSFIYFTCNGIIVGNQGNSNENVSAVLPVRKGDVVTIQVYFGQANHGVYFVPCN